METTRKNEYGMSTLGWLLLGALVVVVIFMFTPLTAPGVNLNIPNPVTEGERVLGELAVDGDEQLIGDIVVNPDKYNGRAVTVRGEIEEIRTMNALTLDAPGIEPQMDLLVITKMPLGRVEGDRNDFFYDNNQRVQVSGTVQRFNLRQLEAQMGMDLDDAMFNDMNNQAVIVAQQIQVVDKPQQP